MIYLAIYLVCGIITLIFILRRDYLVVTINALFVALLVSIFWPFSLLAYIVYQITEGNFSINLESFSGIMNNWNWNWNWKHFWQGFFHSFWVLRYYIFIYCYIIDLSIAIRNHNLTGFFGFCWAFLTFSIMTWIYYQESGE